MNIRDLLLRSAVKIGQKTGLIKIDVVRNTGAELTRHLLPEELKIEVGASSYMIISSIDITYYYGSENMELGVGEAIVENLKEGDKFIDVGAYIGYYSLLAQEAVGVSGLVIAFEPHPKNYRKLLGNITLNSYTNIIPEKMAVLEREGIASSSVDNVMCRYTATNKAKRTTVKITSLDKYFEGHGIVPNVIKIDVEGGEYSVLKGMKKTMEKYSPTIICEIPPSELKSLGIEPKNLFELLKGYKLFFFSERKNFGEIDKRALQPV